MLTTRLHLNINTKQSISQLEFDLNNHKEVWYPSTSHQHIDGFTTLHLFELYPDKLGVWQSSLCLEIWLNAGILLIVLINLNYQVWSSRLGESTFGLGLLKLRTSKSTADSSYLDKENDHPTTPVSFLWICLQNENFPCLYFTRSCNQPRTSRLINFVATVVRLLIHKICWNW